MGKNKINGTLKIPMGNKARLKHLQRARNELGKAGVSFDSGYDLIKNVFDWELDYSLKGAELLEGEVLRFDVEAIVDEKLKYILLAEVELVKAGVVFEYGFDDTNHRLWKLDKVSGATSAVLVVRK